MEAPPSPKDESDSGDFCIQGADTKGFYLPTAACSFPPFMVALCTDDEIRGCWEEQGTQEVPGSNFLSKGPALHTSRKQGCKAPTPESLTFEPPLRPEAPILLTPPRSLGCPPHLLAPKSDTHLPVFWMDWVTLVSWSCWSQLLTKPTGSSQASVSLPLLLRSCLHAGCQVAAQCLRERELGAMKESLDDHLCMFC